VSRSVGPALALLLLGLGLLFWLALGGVRPSLLGGPGPLDARQLEGSSYDDGPKGAADLFRMLTRTRDRVDRWTRPLTQLPPGGTLVVVAPATTMHLEEQRQLLLHAEAGGTVLLVADELPELLEARGLGLRKVPLPAASRPQVPSPLVDPSAPLESRGMALLAPAPSVLSLYGSAHGARVATVAVGQGRMLVVTDPFILSNEGIRRDGNLRFAWRLAHDLPEPVHFDERHHGFEPQRGVLAYARARQLWPSMLLAGLLVLLTLWRLALRPAPSLPVVPRRPAGPAALVAPLAQRLSEARSAPSLSPLLEAEARRRGIDLPPSSTRDPEAWLLTAARLLSPRTPKP
jgi:hypothetical protein